MFKAIYTNGDSKLSKEEISIYLKETFYSSEGNSYDLLEEIFMSKDKDKNGYVSHEEFFGSKHDEL